MAGPAQPAAGRRARSTSSHAPLNPDEADADRDPPVAARRAAVAHRAARRREARVPRRPQRPVRHLPRLGAVQEAAAVGDGRRARRDLPAVGPRQRPHRPGVGRAARRAPGQAQLQRAALGEAAGRRDGATRRSRCTASRSSPAARSTTPGSTPRCRGSCSSATRWSRATGTPTTSSSTTTARCSQRLEELEHRARRRDILVDDETLFDVLRRAAARPTSSPCATSTRWWKKASREQPDLLTFTEDLLVSDDAGAVSAEDYPQVWQQGALEPAGDLPVRARAPRPTASPCTSRSHVLNQVVDVGLRLAGARAAPGAGDRADQVAAQGHPPALRPRAGPRPGRAGRQRPGRRARGSPTSWAGRCKARTGFGVDPEEWDWSRVPDHLRITFRVEDRSRQGAGRGQGPAGAAGPARAADAPDDGAGGRRGGAAGPVAVELRRRCRRRSSSAAASG